MRKIPVRQHRSLGLASGTRRVHNGEHVIGLDPGNHLIERVFADTFSKISNGIKTIRLEVEDVTQAAVLIANLFKRLCMRGITGKGDDRIHLFDDGRGLPGGIGFIHGHAYRADCGAGKIDDSPFVAGRRIDDHHASGLDP